MQKIYKRATTLFLSLLLVSCNGPTNEPVDNTYSSLNYQIFVRSFADSDGDGIGDLNGIKNKIPYLKKIGVKSIWMTPIHKTSSDHGYDVQDYYSIAKDLGTMEDFESLVAELDKNNMNIIMDMVFNHTSASTTYFKNAYEDFKKEVAGETVENSKSSWFNFSTESRAHYVKYKDVYVESNFSTTSMVDFNLQNDEVIAELGNVLNFWADKGVKGYRFDAVKYFVGTTVREETIEVCNKLKAFQPDLYYVGEAWDEDPYYLYKYYESNFDAFFNFSMSASTSQKGNLFANTVNGSPINLYSAVTGSLDKIEKANPSNNSAVPAYFLTNHDMDRVSSLTDDKAKLKLVASVTYLLPGTPFIYYGEELGMKGVRPANANTDADRRMPMLFEESSRCTELRGTTFANQITEDVDTQLADENSVLNHYIRVGGLRNKMGLTVRNGTYAPYDTAYNYDYPKLYAYTITDGEKSYSVLTNLHHEETYSFELTHSYQKVIGFVNAKDNKIKYNLRGSSLELPSYSTIILEN